MVVDTSARNRILEQTHILCDQRQASLLYLTVFGSRLYGTDTSGRSDLDVRGVFLPSLASLAMGDAPHSLHRSSGGGGHKNTASDVDIDLWSLQHWLLKLLPRGDIGGLDLLFSPSNAACTLYRDPRLDDIFAQPLRVLDTAASRSWAEYSLNQAKKYGIPGTRLGAYRSVARWLREHAPDPDQRLETILTGLTEACADDRYCTLQETGGETGLRLGGKIHPGNIRIAEFMRRIDRDLKQYGWTFAEERVEAVDFKALSHALRALDQMEELLTTGRVVFPLRTRDALIAVKQGAYGWPELEARILDRLRAIDGLLRRAPFQGRADPGFARERILSCYGM